jgi:hypothetical protein
VGFEPTTFRLRARSSASNWTEAIGSCLLTLGAASIWSDPDGDRSVVRMIIGMITAHAILRRMAVEQRQRGLSDAAPKARCSQVT